MQHRTFSLGLVVTSLALLALAAPGQAQQSPQDMVPFKAVVNGTFPVGFVVPGNPTIISFQVTWPGQSELLGAFTYLESSQAPLGADGVPLAVNNAVAAMIAANGDAIFLHFSGVVRATATGIGCDHSFVVVGGKGRFAGATGSGTAKGVSDLAKNQGTLTWDGTITRPAAKPQ